MNNTTRIMTDDDLTEITDEVEIIDENNIKVKGETFTRIDLNVEGETVPAYVEINALADNIDLS